MKTWTIRGDKYQFPSNWDKKQVVSFVNQNIRVCPNCGKVDVSMNHFNNCNPQGEALKQQNLEYCD